MLASTIQIHSYMYIFPVFLFSVWHVLKNNQYIYTCPFNFKISHLAPWYGIIKSWNFDKGSFKIYLNRTDWILTSSFSDMIKGSFKIYLNRTDWILTSSFSDMITDFIEYTVLVQKQKLMGRHISSFNIYFVSNVVKMHPFPTHQLKYSLSLNLLQIS